MTCCIGSGRRRGRRWGKGGWRGARKGGGRGTRRLRGWWRKCGGEVEGDEVYVVAGHKGCPEIVRKLGRKGRRRRLQGQPGRGALDKENPPIFGLFQRNGDVAIQMLPNVQQVTIRPILMNTVKPGSLLYTDEYD